MHTLRAWPYSAQKQGQGWNTFQNQETTSPHALIYQFRSHTHTLIHTGSHSKPITRHSRVFSSIYKHSPSITEPQWTLCALWLVQPSSSSRYGQRRSSQSSKRRGAIIISTPLSLSVWIPAGSL